MEIYSRTLDALDKEPKVAGGFRPASADADDAVHGLLSWDVESGAELKLVDPEPSWGLHELGRESTIYGWLEDGTEVTLPGARVASTHHGAISFARLRDDMTLLGSNLDSEIPRFTRANARFAHLHEWLPLTGISTPTRELGEHGVERFGVEWEPPQTLEVALDDARLTLNVSMDTEMAHSPEHSIRTSLNASFEFSTSCGLRELEREHLRPLQAFSAFAADRWDVPVYESVRDPNLDQSVRGLLTNPDSLHGTFAFYREWDTMMAQNAERAKRPLTMPVLGIGGEASHSDEVGKAFESLANDVQTAVIPGAGHWFAEEEPKATVAALTPFLAPYRDAAAAAHTAVA